MPNALRLLLVLALLLLHGTGCETRTDDDSATLGDDDSSGDDDDSATLGDDDSASGEPALQLCDPIPPSDPFTLNSAAINGDNLELSVTYSGGCESHDFDLCWSGLVMTSLPPQVNISLIHENNNDSCDALPTEALSFDLSSLHPAASQGEIVIHFEGQTLNYTF